MWVWSELVDKGQIILSPQPKRTHYQSADHRGLVCAICESVNQVNVVWTKLQIIPRPNQSRCMTGVVKEGLFDVTVVVRIGGQNYTIVKLFRHLNN
jgi:hypothetical protein